MTMMMMMMMTHLNVSQRIYANKYCRSKTLLNSVDMLRTFRPLSGFARFKNCGRRGTKTDARNVQVMSNIKGGGNVLIPYTIWILRNKYQIGIFSTSAHFIYLFLYLFQ